MVIPFVKEEESVYVPQKATAHSNGFDLYSIEDVTLNPGETKKVSTGISLNLPEGVFAFLTPRSGLALKHSITLMNSPGLVDSDYRGVIQCILHNHGKVKYEVNIGDRIAQMVVMKQPHSIEMVETKNNEMTERGNNGFGSSGK